MSSSDRKWVDTRMLKTIRRAVPNQAIRDHEREDMEQFLSIPSPAPAAVNLPTSAGYMEARDKGRKLCSTTAATAGPVLRLRLNDQENLHAWHKSDRLLWAELSRTAVEYRWATGWVLWTSPVRSARRLRLLVRHSRAPQDQLVGNNSRLLVHHKLAPHYQSIRRPHTFQLATGSLPEINSTGTTPGEPRRRTSRGLESYTDATRCTTGEGAISW